MCAPRDMKIARPQREREAVGKSHTSADCQGGEARNGFVERFQTNSAASFDVALRNK